MSEAKSDLAFPDCREFWNAALGSEKGWRATFKEKGHATNFRLRCYGVRRRELIFNAKLYNDGDAMRHQTIWDGIALHIRETEHGWAVLAIKGEDGSLEAITVEQGPIE